ncbi:MAG TPA: P1 family peptidase [Gemmatimonadales bacterium]|nr:P1 family peptidase [Gemmatimonadales bacterium]
MTLARRALTAVSGLSVGHWTAPGNATGCTVILAPAGGARAACAIRGRATGTREIDALDPRHLVGRVDAVLLTGGSAYGLGAADGVMGWLRERKRGFPVGPAGVVPIVPSAVIFDLGLFGPADRWPTGPDAARACDAAGAEFAEGSVGAGAGATVGKVRGPAGAMKGGLGTWAGAAGEVIVSALVVTNAFGDVRDGAGTIIAGARADGGGFVDAIRYLAEGGPPLGRVAGHHTTLAVVATNARLDRIELAGLAQAGCDALARRITPYGSILDGDVTFALSTAAVDAVSPLQVEALAAEVVPQALERAVRLAGGTPAIPGLADGARR